jgi:hypothetical protein
MDSNNNEISSKTTTSGKIYYEFSDSGTFTISDSSVTINYFLVGGGDGATLGAVNAGAGLRGSNTYKGGNGGNGGGILNDKAKFAVGTYTVNVGKGGSAENANPAGNGTASYIQSSTTTLYTTADSTGAGGGKETASSNASNDKTDGKINLVTCPIDPNKVYGKGGSSGGTYILNSTSVKGANGDSNTGNGGNGGKQGSTGNGVLGGNGGSGVVLIWV